MKEYEKRPRSKMSEAKKLYILSLIALIFAIVSLIIPLSRLLYTILSKQ